VRLQLQRVAGAGIGLGLAVALSGCASSHNSLGTGSSTCFQALPSATSAVHNRGQLLGVRRVVPSQLHHPLPGPPNASPRAVCVVAFQGKFQPGDVEHEITNRSGNYAIIVVGEHGGVPLRAVVTDRLPLRFRHLS
jgi:hypothetical protein